MFALSKFLKKQRHKRIADRTNFKVMFQFIYGDTEHMGVLRDLSINGFSFSTALEIKQGKKIDVEIFIKYGDSHADLQVLFLNEKAEIKWVKPNYSVQLVDYDAGCEFVEPNKNNQEKLGRILDMMSGLIRESKT